MTAEAAAATRCGFIAVLGAPNVGKSTLVNQLVGAKVTIVTPKVQTTRSRMTAIAMAGASQLVFVDTPGIFEPRRRLEKAMVSAAWSGAKGADLVVLVVDATRGLDGDTARIVDGIEGRPSTALLALNKIDVTPNAARLELARALNERLAFARTFMISALSGDGVDDLRRHLAEAVPHGPWLYPPEQLADVPLRLLAAEATREQIFLRLYQELPYAITVETESWHERDDGGVRIEQVIYVRRDSQKAIVLGKRGAGIKAIGAAARAELEVQLDRRVHLFLFVKVRKDWPDDPERYREMGLDFPR